MKDFPPFRLDAADQSLWRDDQRIALTPKAFAVLHYLVERAGRLVTQNELLEALWPDTFVQPEVLKSQILDVRTALGDKPKEPRFIETLPRRGYRFIAPVRDLVEAPPPPAAEISSGTLVGRDQPVAELRESLRKAAAGERQVVFITGEQGIGKTTLVETFLQQAGSVQFARGQCLEGFGVVKEPYYPVLEALGQVARGPRSPLLARTLETHAPTWLIQLPVLMKPEHRTTLQRELVGATRERMIRELCEALESLTAEFTLVLLFEDLHWSDHSTVDLISAIAYRRAPARLMLIGTYRPVDIVLSRHPLKQASHSLKAHRLCREIALSPLAETEVAEYLARQAGSPHPAMDAAGQHLARWIRRQTEGNPLFMVTIVEHLQQLGYIALHDSIWTVPTPLDQIHISLPDTLREMIELQIEQLSPREQLILDAAGVQGVMFSAAVTAAALDIDADGVEDTCQKLAQQHHIIRAAAAEQLPDGTFSQRYEFVHAAFRHVFYHRLAPARRAKLHRRFAETLEALRAGDRADAAAELAGHFEQCAEWARAVEYLGIAARNAWQRFDYRGAIAILEHTLQILQKLPPPQRIPTEIRTLNVLTIFQHGLHEIERVLPTLETLADRAAEYGIADVEARARTGLAVVRSSEDRRLSAPYAERIQALISLQETPLAQQQMRLPYSCFRITAFGWDEQLAGEIAAGVEQVRQGGDKLAGASLLLDYCFLLWASSRYADCIQHSRECLPLMLESGRLVRYLQGLDLIAVNLGFLGRWGEALDLLDESIDNAVRNEAPRRLLMPLLFKAWLHLNAFDYQGVLEMSERALASLTSPLVRDRRWIGMRLAASARLGLGDSQTALQQLLELKQAMDECPVMLSWYWRIPLQLDLVEACLRQEDLPRARQEADQIRQLAMATAERTWQGLAWETSARVAMHEGDLARADHDIARALEVIEGYDVPLAAWRVHATAAVLYARNQDEPWERHHRTRSQEVVQSLSRSLDGRPALQQIFAAHTAAAVPQSASPAR